MLGNKRFQFIITASVTLCIILASTIIADVNPRVDGRNSQASFLLPNPRHHISTSSLLVRDTIRGGAGSSSSSSSSNNKDGIDEESDSDRMRKTVLKEDQKQEKVTYNEARNIRVKYGHNAAVSLYQNLLSQNIDVTAATRIAASKSSPCRHDKACPVPSLPLSSLNENNTCSSTRNHGENEKLRDAIHKFRNILERSRYNNENVQCLFGVPSRSKTLDKLKFDSEANLRIFNDYVDNMRKEDMLSFAQSPIYIKPVGAGSQSTLPSLLDGIMYTGNGQKANGDESFVLNPIENNDEKEEEYRSSLKCLVSLFLLGFAVPRDILSKSLIGGEETISLLEYLGLLFPCDIDPNIMVPYVHLFPLDVDVVMNDPNDYDKSISYNCSSNTAQIVLVTDCHPTVLSRTTLGDAEDGAVMYIGPDSLALLQHLPLQQYISSLPIDGNKNTKIIDFCAGSGVQAISTLVSLQQCRPDSTALFVDINDRALRFAKFNAILNGIKEERISTINFDITADNDFIEYMNEYDNEPFDIILANPPFIPVPEKSASNNSGSGDGCIKKRYGLFSSGGPSGEEVLESIISLSPKLLRPGRGLLAIVSEFMNPPEEKGGNHILLHKIKKWWRALTTSSKPNDSEDIVHVHGKGILLTNEYPVTAATYSARRADNKLEFNTWSNHLKSCHIDFVSPGLMFAKLCEQRMDKEDGLILTSSQVPRTALGSIWTPFNIQAVYHTKRACAEIMK